MTGKCNFYVQKCVILAIIDNNLRYFDESLSKIGILRPGITNSIPGMKTGIHQSPASVLPNLEYLISSHLLKNTLLSKFWRK
jgi:hypothetical protein